MADLLSETPGWERSRTLFPLALWQHRRHLSDDFASLCLTGYGNRIVMGRYDLSDERVLEFLIRVSQASNTNVCDVAQQLVDAASEGRHEATST